MLSVLGCAAQQNVTVWVLLLLLELGDESKTMKDVTGGREGRMEGDNRFIRSRGL
jgi:hypothetical protein